MEGTALPTSHFLRAAMFYVFAEELRSATNPSDEDFFHTIVADAIDNFGIEPSAFASMFLVTRATVSRWKNREAAPGEYNRNAVRTWIAQEAEKRARALPDVDFDNVVRFVAGH